VHVVRAGETLQTIGSRYGVPWQSIAAANGLAPDAILQLDQRLVIPQG
jgi:LysM repeat protein